MKKLIIFMIIQLSFNSLMISQKKSVFLSHFSFIFDFSSVEKIYFNPKEILEDIDAFWKTDKAYIHTKKWHESAGVRIPIKSWKRTIRKTANLSDYQVKNSKAILIAEKLIESEVDFLKKAIPHIAEFLPKSTPAISANIYFNDKTVPHAFAIEGDNIFIYIK